MTIDTNTFRGAAGSFASGVTVITSAAGGRVRGMTASAVCSLSLDPTYMLACLDKQASTLTLIRESRLFNVNILAADQEHLARNFAAKSFARELLFDAETCALNEDGIPMVNGAAACFECRLAEELDGGDHVILIGEVLRVDADTGKAPLVYFRGGYGDFHLRPKPESA